jgi:hypothetical protein
MHPATHDRRARTTPTEPVEWPLTAEDVERTPPPRMPVSTWTVWGALAVAAVLVALAILAVTS